MTNSLGDILRDYDLDEPLELKRVKAYVREKFQIVPLVGFQNDNIVITVPSAALAGSLRMHVYQIKEAAETTKKIVVRIGR
jgi:hypothetical protein